MVAGHGRRRAGPAPPPGLDLGLAVLIARVVLVHARQRAVVAFIELPAAFTSDNDGGLVQAGSAPASRWDRLVTSPARLTVPRGPFGKEAPRQSLEDDG